MCGRGLCVLLACSGYLVNGGCRCCLFWDWGRWGGCFRKPLPTSFFPFRLLSSYNPGIPESPIGGEGSANLNSHRSRRSRFCTGSAAVLTGECSVWWGNALALESFGLAASSAISGCVISGSSPHFSQPRSPHLWSGGGDSAWLLRAGDLVRWCVSLCRVPRRLRGHGLSGQWE